MCYNFSMGNDFTYRKYMGDDEYSWAVFRKPVPRGIITDPKYRPLATGLSRMDARHIANRFSNPPKKDDDVR